jgi:hypothetical protein
MDCRWKARHVVITVGFDLVPGSRPPVPGAQATGGETIEIEGPAFTRFLFGNSQAGLFWLPIRLFLGFSWLEAGYHKFADGGWIDGGAALRAYWERAASIPEGGRPAISYDWYRSFIQSGKQRRDGSAG